MQSNAEVVSSSLTWSTTLLDICRPLLSPYPKEPVSLSLAFSVPVADCLPALVAPPQAGSSSPWSFLPAVQATCCPQPLESGPLHKASSYFSSQALPFLASSPRPQYRLGRREIPARSTGGGAPPGHRRRKSTRRAPAPGARTRSGFASTAPSPEPRGAWRGALWVAGRQPDDHSGELGPRGSAQGESGAAAPLRPNCRRPDTAGPCPLSRHTGLPGPTYRVWEMCAGRFPLPILRLLSPGSVYGGASRQ